MKISLLLATLILSLSLSAAERPVTSSQTFASQAASVDLPASLLVVAHTETLVATFGESHDHKVEISFNAVPDGTEASGIDFVRSSASKSGSPIRESADRAVFMDAATDVERDGKIYRIAHWQIGVPRGVFVLTVTAPMPMTDELSEFIGTGLNQIINSVSARAL